MRVLIIDDHEVLRAGVRTLLERNPEIEVCGEASDGLEGVQKAVQLKPDLVILDIDMPVLDGFSTAREISKLSPSVPILLLSLHVAPNLIAIAKSSGASGYVAKNQAAFVLLKAVDTVTHNQTFFPD
jgi:DNA-binding NarL/FixJ family response regulator